MNILFLVLFTITTLSLIAASPVVKRQAGRKVHVVIIDGGSSGTRVHLYKFRYTNKLELEADVIKGNKPGLSSFANSPQEAVGKVKELMQVIATEEEASLRPEILIKATAGLRLLSTENPQQVDTILNDIEQFLRVNMSRYVQVPTGAVSILPGIKEGTYFWLAANYLMGVLGNSQEMYGTLELGGASTQITFLADENIAKNVPKDFLDDLDIFGQHYKLYSHSYLHYGINEANLRFFSGIPNGCRQTGCLLNRNKPVVSPCLSSAFSGKLKLSDSDVQVQGERIDDAQRYDTCVRTATSFVREVVQQDLPKLKSKVKFLASGAYVQLVQSAGIKLDRLEGISISQIEEKTKHVCRMPATTGVYEPYDCMSLAYIIAVLRDGYGFTDNDKIAFADEIGGYLVGWPLGLALHEADKHLKRK